MVGAHNQQSNGTAFSVDRLAILKALPSDELRSYGLHDLPGGGVGVPYYTEDGADVAIKIRGTADRSSYRWPAGVKTVAYGLWRLDECHKAGVAFLVEGESDSWTLWHHGIPCLGIPGANNARATIEQEHIDGLHEIYLVKESDQGGETFVKQCVERLTSIGYRGRLYVLTMPEGIKDTSELHCDDPERFLERWTEAVSQAQRIELQGPKQSPPPHSGNSVNSVTHVEWTEPAPLTELPKVLPFPLDALPDPLAKFAQEASWGFYCPLDYLGVSMLALASGAIANSRLLAITSTHRESACLYACIVGRPGTRKSAPLKRLSRPFDEMQRSLIAKFKERLKDWEDTDPEERGGKPILQRVIVRDITTESLKLILNENRRGFVQVKDELSGLVAGLNQYKGGKGSDRQDYLSIWSGEPVTTDRKSDKERKGVPLFVLDPFLSIIGGIQPSVLTRLQGDRHGGSPADDDGFTDRFLFAYPDDVPEVEEQWRDVPDETMRAWDSAIHALLSMQMKPIEGEEPVPYYVHLSADARKVWQDFTREHAAEVNAREFPEKLRGPWSKMRGYCGRLSLVAHYLRRASGDDQGEGLELDGESMRRGVLLVHYFKSHARRAYAQMGTDSRTAGARKVLAWILNKRVTQFTVRDVYRDLRKTFHESVDALKAPLQLLESHGFIRQEEQVVDRKGPGRKPSPGYQTNPLFLNQGTV